MYIYIHPLYASKHPIHTLNTPYIHPIYTLHTPYIHPTRIPNSYTRQVKIVVATNAAESSITLPDCDHVICLGTAKRMEYDMEIRYIFSVVGVTHMCTHTEK